LLAVSLIDTLTFNPPVNWFGQANISFRAWDGGSIIAGEISSAVSSQSYSAAIQVHAVNDEPVFSKSRIRAPHVPADVVQTSSHAVTVVIAGSISEIEAGLVATRLSFILEASLILEGVTAYSEQ